ncbi:uncharacterized protein LOC108669297 [Hyalella azteca]|uniref:Uncharacterized protein LOC108669297 n=1 Tax=Hyalella azteca TaxID=294128 RepID=A0A8B7NEQ2_HYAAZ|nr:uncharacterized protein LOC108669297 [Hyalella azteca]
MKTPVTPSILDKAKLKNDLHDSGIESSSSEVMPQEAPRKKQLEKETVVPPHVLQEAADEIVRDVEDEGDDIFEPRHMRDNDHDKDDGHIGIHSYRHLTESLGSSDTLPSIDSPCRKDTARHTLQQTV